MVNSKLRKSKSCSSSYKCKYGMLKRSVRDKKTGKMRNCKKAPRKKSRRKSRKVKSRRKKAPRKKSRRKSRKVKSRRKKAPRKKSRRKSRRVKSRRKKGRSTQYDVLKELTEHQQKIYFPGGINSENKRLKKYNGNYEIIVFDWIRGNFSVDEHVEARSGGREEWDKATITSVNHDARSRRPDGTYNLKYDNGDVAESVKRDLIRTIGKRTPGGKEKGVLNVYSGKIHIKCNLCDDDEDPRAYLNDCVHKKEFRENIFSCFKELFHTVIKSHFDFIETTVLQCMAITCLIIAYKAILGTDNLRLFEDTSLEKKLTNLTAGGCDLKKQILIMETDIMVTTGGLACNGKLKELLEVVTVENTGNVDSNALHKDIWTANFSKQKWKSVHDLADGKKVIKSEDGTLYDPETREKLGKWNKADNTLVTA